MKSLYNKLKLVAGAILLAIVAVSCLPETQTMGDAGQTLVRVSPSEFALIAFDAKTTSQTAVLFEVRRDVHSPDALKSSTTVELNADPTGAILTKYNSINHTNFVTLPTNLATTNPAPSAGKLTVTFGPGEFAKPVIITVPNAGNFDFSKSYALAYEVTSVSGTGILATGVNDTIVAQVLVKNRFDGKYEVTGTFVDYVTTTWTGYYPKSVNLETSGALSVKKYDTDYALYGYIFQVDATTVSQFGNWTPAFNFDANNNVISVVNTTVDPAPRSRTAVLYTGPDAMANKWDPATKTLRISYQLRQETVTPQLRNLIHETYIYKGPR